MNRKETRGMYRLSEPAALIDPYPIYADLRHTFGPLFWDQEAARWICTGYHEAHAILSDTQGHFAVKRLSSCNHLQGHGREKLVAHNLRPQPDPMHHELRRCIASRTTGEAENAWQAHIQVLVHEQLTTFKQMPGQRRDLVDDFAALLPLRISATLLELPDDTFEYVFRWAESYAAIAAGCTETGGPHRHAETSPYEHHFRRLEEAMRYFVELASLRLAHPQDDLVSDLVRVLFSQRGADRDDEAEEKLNLIATNCLLLLAGGYQTVGSLIAEGLWWLWRFPKEREKLERRPDFATSLIDETLRLNTFPQYLVRQALRDTIVGKKRVSRGQAIQIFTGAANRDERVYPEPDMFSIDRVHRQPSLSFGVGEHLCLGAPLTRSLAQSAITAFLQEIPSYQIIGDASEWMNTPSARTLRHLPALLIQGQEDGQELGEPAAHSLDLLTVEPGVVTIRLSTTRKRTLTFSIDPDSDQIVVSTPHAAAHRPEQEAVSMHLPVETPERDALPSRQQEEQEQETIPPPTPDEIAERLHQLYAGVLSRPPEQVDASTDFLDAGGDSLAVVALLSALSRYLDIDLDPAEVYDHPALGELTAVVGERLANTRETTENQGYKKEGIYA